MAIKTRINPKTGKVQYRARYYWNNGIKRMESETAWFDSEQEAYRQQVLLKKAKELKAKEERLLENNKVIETILKEWINELEGIAYRKTMENTTTDVSYFQKARTLLKLYTSDEILNTKVRDIDVGTFRKWLTYINDQEISGSGVRDFKKLLVKFNRYLADNGYYLSNTLDLDVDMAIQRVKVKPKKAGRRNRYCPTITDIKAITNAYFDLGLEEFKWFYWYTLFTVLFYSGMRVEELVGLVWENVHLDVARPYIDVVNAISERESSQNVKERMKAGIVRTKNERSNREIPIFDYYYDILVSYKNKYIEKYKPKYVDEMFVFPNINSKNGDDRTNYQKHKNILRELDRICIAAEVPKTDCQMFRHGCATWLVLDERQGGLGFTESQAKDYFGHTYDDMLRDVYAKLNKKQRANRTSETFKDLAKHNPYAKEIDELSDEIKLTKLIKDPKANQKHKDYAIMYRLRDEMIDCIVKERVFNYYIKDLPYIDAALEELEQHNYNSDNLKMNYVKTADDERFALEVVNEMKRIKDNKIFDSKK